ncbi:MAG TPA: amidohydrolase family protein [Hyphomicrobiaceae bacterium]
MNQRIVDCHAHLIDPARFPLSGEMGYKPKPEETGTREEFCRLLDENGVAHAVLVQLSGYGTDNSILLEAMRACPGRFKAIAVVDADISDAELERLSHAGVIGVRFNLVSYDADHLLRPGTKHLLTRIKELGWFAQVFADDAQWLVAADLLRASGVRVLVDHFGLTGPEGIRNPGFAAVCDLALDGIATIKLSAPFRISRRRPEYDDLDPIVELLLTKVGPDSLIWGSDWPFPGVSPRLSYGDTLAPLARWLTSPEDREKVLWQTPARLFGFEEPKA